MGTKIIRSPLFYVGDKYKLLKEILPNFPNEINRFIEPFAGGGSVFLNVNANKYLLNDIDKYVFNLHNFLIKHSKSPQKFFNEIEKIIFEYNLSRSYKEDIIPTELKIKYKKTYFAKFNKNSFEKLKTDFNNEKEIDLYKFYVLLIYGFNRMIRFNGSGKYNLPVGNVDFNKNVVTALENYFDKVKTEKIKWYNKDYTDFLKSVKPQQDDFIYFDPPYLITFSEYNKLWDEKKELELIKTLDLLNKNKIRFAVSNVTHYKDKENKIFNKWSSNYNIIPIKSNYISYHDNSIKSFREVLVTNYE
ncbi:DNA adenine methylase [Tenuifilum osseticum]|jgi:DNA adenine methylase|uniref:DNA adenine methylase n=2 Tax=Tenuifilum TaxID=2760873 RepID=UPI0034E5A424